MSWLFHTGTLNVLRQATFTDTGTSTDMQNAQCIWYTVSSLIVCNWQKCCLNCSTFIIQEASCLFQPVCCQCNLENERFSPLFNYRRAHFRHGKRMATDTQPPWFYQWPDLTQFHWPFPKLFQSSNAITAHDNKGLCCRNHHFPCSMVEHQHARQQGEGTDACCVGVGR